MAPSDSKRSLSAISNSHAQVFPYCSSCMARGKIPRFYRGALAASGQELSPWGRLTALAMSAHFLLRKDFLQAAKSRLAISPHPCLDYHTRASAPAMGLMFSMPSEPDFLNIPRSIATRAAVKVIDDDGRPLFGSDLADIWPSAVAGLQLLKLAAH